MEEKGLVYFGYYCCTIFLKSYLCLFSSMVLLSRTVGSFKIIIVKSEIQAIFYLSVSIHHLSAVLPWQFGIPKNL